MGDQSAIEWTEATWNPLLGCSRVSEGCRHCYAERVVLRVGSGKHRATHGGLVKRTEHGPRWTGEVRLNEGILGLPLRWSRPRRIFVNSLSDLFHESVKDEWIAAIFAVMMLAGHHTYQVLTKRAERMARWCQWFQAQSDQAGVLFDALEDVSRHVGSWPVARTQRGPWPKPHIWLGVSVEDQATADARIPLLLQTPAAVRWVSYEPALGPVDFQQAHAFACHEHHYQCSPSCDGKPGIRWLVVGGESGPGARPFDLAWARSVIAQGRAAGVPVFVKQLGARPQGYRCITDGGEAPLPVILRDRKGGDPAEWPEDLRVREYPTPKGVTP